MTRMTICGAMVLLLATMNGINVCQGAKAMVNTKVLSLARPMQKKEEQLPFLEREVIKTELVANIEELGEKGASMSSAIFNLVKCIVGAGVLGLPSGVAALGGTPDALIPGNLLVLFIGAMSGYGFALVGRVCAYTNAKSYKEAWANTLGKSTSWVPTLCCLLVTSCTVLGYSMILSETIPKLLMPLGVAMSRTQALFSITGGVLLPLCLMKSLNALAPFSLVGILGMVWTAIAMAMRYFDGSYRAGGALLGTVPESLQPTFGSETGLPTIFSSSAFVLISMLSTASMAHYNAPKFYVELRNRTLPRYYKVVGASSAISILLFCAITTVGFLTFGQSCSGLVLNNYSSQDGLMSLGRVAVAVSLVCSYPLAFAGVRDGLLDMLGVSASQRREAPVWNTVTLGLLGVVTGLAMVVRDLRLLFAFGGATWGNFVTYPFPVAMFLKYLYDQRKDNDNDGKVPVEAYVAGTVGLLGLVMSAIGTRSAIQVALER